MELVSASSGIRHQHLEDLTMEIGSMIEEEYNKALRTDSFVDIWERAHHQLRRTISTSGAATTTTATSSSSYTSSPEDPGNEGITQASPALSLRYYAHLPDFLLEPSQETLLAATSHGHPHSLILEYFDTTLEACNGCTALLAGIDRTRTNQRSLHRLLIGDTRDLTFFSELASYLQLENPLSTRSLSHIRRTHSLYGPLLHRLKAAHRKLALKVRLLRCVLAVTCGAVTVAMAVVSSDAAQVDAAAKGAYIVGRDLDTMSRMVRRLNVDVEYDRELVAKVLRSRKPEVVRELAREVESGEVREQLEELEEHVYLCLLNINKSRIKVIKEMGAEGD